MSNKNQIYHKIVICGVQAHYSTNVQGKIKIKYKNSHMVLTVSISEHTAVLRHK